MTMKVRYAIGLSFLAAFACAALFGAAESPSLIGREGL